VFAAAKTRVRTKRTPVEVWHSVEVVPVGSPDETAEAMRLALRVVARSFQEWLRQRQGEGRTAADPPSEMAPR
jgi:hypothetical protein